MNGGAILPATELMLTIRPGGPLRWPSIPSSGRNAWFTAIGPIRFHLQLLAKPFHREMGLTGLPP